jgi:hypothetical protein
VNAQDRSREQEDLQQEQQALGPEWAHIDPGRAPGRPWTPTSTNRVPDVIECFLPVNHSDVAPCLPPTADMIHCTRWGPSLVASGTWRTRQKAHGDQRDFRRDGYLWNFHFASNNSEQSHSSVRHKEQKIIQTSWYEGSGCLWAVVYFGGWSGDI